MEFSVKDKQLNRYLKDKQNFTLKYCVCFYVSGKCMLYVLSMWNIKGMLSRQTGVLLFSWITNLIFLFDRMMFLFTTTHSMMFLFQRHKACCFYLERHIAQRFCFKRHIAWSFYFQRHIAWCFCLKRHITWCCHLQCYISMMFLFRCKQYDVSVFGDKGYIILYYVIKDFVSFDLTKGRLLLLFYGQSTCYFVRRERFSFWARIRGTSNLLFYN